MRLPSIESSPDNFMASCPKVDANRGELANRWPVKTTILVRGKNLNGKNRKFGAVAQLPSRSQWFLRMI